MYTLILSFGMLIMCLMLTHPVQQSMIEKFEEHNATCLLLQDYHNCGQIVGYMAIYRIALALVIFFLFFAMFTVNISTSRSCRAGIHNGFWMVKFILVCALCAGAFCIPSSHLDTFSQAWMYVALIGASIFIILQMLIIVDISHLWTNKWKAKAERVGGSQCWYVAMVIFAMTLFSVFATGVILLYIHFTNPIGCTTNKLFISINVALSLLCAIVSVLPYVEKSTGDARAGLMQSAIFALYIMYLTWSSIASEPHSSPDLLSSVGLENGAEDEGNQNDELCYPRNTVLETSDNVLPFIGIIVMFCTVIYSSLSTSQQTFRVGLLFPTPKSNPFEFCCPTAPNLRRVEDDGGQAVIRNEAEGVVYSYSVFHVTYSMATMYLMMLLTNWFRPEVSNSGEDSFDKSRAVVWVKMISSWLCIIVYLWTLLAPKLCFRASNMHKPQVTIPKTYEPETIEMEVQGGV